MKLFSGKYAHYTIIAIAAVVLYGNTVRNKFALDDEFVLRKNDLVQQGVTAIPEIFSTPYFQNNEWSFGYRPLTKAMFALEYEIFGENLPVHHVVNLLLYALCCILLYRIFRDVFSAHTSALFWLIAVLLFMAHPVHTEVVASLKNREELLCTLFSLVGMSVFIRFHETGKWTWLLAGFFAFVLAFLSKQTAAIFVLIVPLTILLKGILGKKPLAAMGRDYRFWLVLAVLAVMTWFFFRLPGWIMPAEKVDLLGFENPLHESYTWNNKILLAAYSLWVYVSLTLFPQPLLYYYGMYVIPEPSAAHIPVWLGIAAFAGALVFVFRRHRKHPLMAWGIAAFIAGLLPFLNLFVPINGIVAERMLFFPVFGFSVVLTCILFAWSRNALTSHTISGKRSGVVWFVLGLILVLYSGKTIIRNGQWKDSVTLFSADMKHLDKSVKANDIYATAVFDEIYRQVTEGKTVKDMNDKLRDVIAKYNRTLELFPENPKAHHNLSTIYLSFFKDARNGLIHAKKAMQLDTANFKVYFNAGQAFHLMGKKDSAEYYYRMTARRNPSFQQAWDQIIRLYTEGGKPATLIPYVEEYNRLYPSSDIALAALGSLYIAERDTQRAMECFEKALVVNPNVPNEKIIPIYRYYKKKNDAAKTAYYEKMLK